MDVISDQEEVDWMARLPYLEPNSFVQELHQEALADEMVLLKEKVKLFEEATSAFPRVQAPDCYEEVSSPFSDRTSDPSSTGASFAVPKERSYVNTPTDSLSTSDNDMRTVAMLKKNSIAHRECVKWLVAQGRISAETEGFYFESLELKAKQKRYYHRTNKQVRDSFQTEKCKRKDPRCVLLPQPFIGAPPTVAAPEASARESTYPTHIPEHNEDRIVNQSTTTAEEEVLELRKRLAGLLLKFDASMKQDRGAMEAQLGQTDQCNCMH